MQTVNANPNVKVTGRHLAITDAINDYATRKIEGLHLDYPKIIEAHVILGVEKYRHWAEVVLVCSNHITIEAREETNDLYAALDAVTDKIARQMRKYKNAPPPPPSAAQGRHPAHRRADSSSGADRRRRASRAHRGADRALSGQADVRGRSGPPTRDVDPAVSRLHECAKLAGQRPLPAQERRFRIDRAFVRLTSRCQRRACRPPGIQSSCPYRMRPAPKRPPLHQSL